MGYEITCDTFIKNTGQSECSVNYGRVVAHLLVPRTFEIASQALAATLATYITAINDVGANRMRPIMPSWRQEYVQDEPVFQPGAQQDEDYLYTNSNKDTFYLKGSKITPKFNANMQTLSNGLWSYYKLTSNGFILGKTTDNIKLLPIPCSLRMLPQRKNTDAEGAELAYTVRDESTDDWNLFGAAIKPATWNPLTDLSGLRDVNLSIVGTPTATEIVVDVKTDLNAYGVSGYVVGDFLFYKTSDNSAQTPTGVTPSTSFAGRYTFAFAAAVTGYVNLKAPSDATKKGYESLASVNFTI